MAGLSNSALPVGITSFLYVQKVISLPSNMISPSSTGASYTPNLKATSLEAQPSHSTQPDKNSQELRHTLPNNKRPKPLTSNDRHGKSRVEDQTKK